jgi:molybdenum cofactor biosynthesis enzyme MoaA
MRIQTFSILAGSEACNARCPFCVSKMTPPNGMELKEPGVNWRNFGLACQLAARCGVTTAMITGKGEPTLFPSQIDKYMDRLAEAGSFPLIEMQSNGIPIAERPEVYDPHLKHWYERGMTTIAVSIVHYAPEKNREIYLPYREHYIDLPGLVDRLHGHGLAVRLACIMARGYVDGRAELERLVAFAHEHKVEQLTVRPVNKPKTSRNLAVWDWSAEHALTDEQHEELASYFRDKGTQVMRLQHGGIVYDVGGQNVCLTDSLTLEPQSEEIRQLIFFPDGHLRYDWQYEGALLL